MTVGRETMMEEAIRAFIEGIDYETVRMTYGAQVTEGTEWNITKHSHAVMEIIYMTDAKVYIEGTEKNIHSVWSDVVIYPAYTVHQEYVDVNKKQKCMYIWLDVKSSESLTAPFIIKDVDGQLHWLIKELVALNKNGNGELEKKLIKTYIQAMFLNIQRNVMNKEVKKDIVEQAIHYMQCHYADDMTIEELAKELYINPTYLCRVFKKKIEMTPMQYLIHLRIETAKKLLITTDFSVNEIAEYIGICDSKYFSKLFKKKENITPSEFRSKSKKSTLFNN